MTERLVTAAPETTQILPARLEPDAIGAAQDTIIGMANSAPTVAIGLSLAGLAAAPMRLSAGSAQWRPVTGKDWRQPDLVPPREPTCW